MSEESKLPNGWAEDILETFLDYIQPTEFIVSSTEYDDSYKTPVLTAGKTFILGYTNETYGIFKQLPTIIFDDFTTAIKFVNFPFKVKSSAMKILVPTHKEVNMKYVYYFMETLRLNADTHKRYWISVGSQVKFPIAPITEQQRIVSKIEELFSSLDKAIEDINTAKEQLKVYRQAVLKYAFEGRFTNNNVVDGELPESWKLKIISDVAETIGGYAFKSSEFKSSGKFQVIRIGNIRPGVIRLDESPVFISNLDNKVIKSSQLKINDLVITQTGTKGKRDYGYTALIKHENLLLNQRIASVRCNISCIPKFLMYYTWTKKFKNQFFSYETGNVGQGNVGIKAITNTEIFIPEVKEQTFVVSEIESRLSVCDKIEESIKDSLLQAEALKQSILKKAFEGKLVPQDPNDEPANKLIERIKAESANNNVKKSKKTKA